MNNNDKLTIEELYDIYIMQKQKYIEYKHKSKLILDRILNEVEPYKPNIYRIYRNEDDEIIYMDIELDKRNNIWHGTWISLKQVNINLQSMRDNKLTKLLITDKDLELGELYYKSLRDVRNNSYDMFWNKICHYVSDKLSDIYNNRNIYTIPPVLIVDICGNDYYVKVNCDNYIPYFTLTECIKEKPLKID